MASPKFKTRYPDIDYDWRPASYWDPAANPLAILLTNVKGANRRELIRTHFEEGRLDELPDALKDAELSDEMVGLLASLGPTFMGGEFLPEYWAGEIEIARVSLESTTGDVVSIRARPIDDGIGYRAVDEYDTEYYVGPDESEEPLTLDDLIGLLDGAEKSDQDGVSYGLAMDAAVGNYEHHEYASREEMLEDAGSFAAVTSEIYESLGEHYRRLTEDWYEAERQELEESGEP